jgi:hypothetical protein
VLDQPRQRAHVFRTISQNGLAFIGIEWRPLHNPVAHFGFMRSVDPVLAEVPQRAAEAVETLLAVAALDATVVHEVAEFDIGIESTSGLPPTTCDVKAELSAR